MRTHSKLTQQTLWLEWYSHVTSRPGGESDKMCLGWRTKMYCGTLVFFTNSFGGANKSHSFSSLFVVVHQVFVLCSIHKHFTILVTPWHMFDYVFRFLRPSAFTLHSKSSNPISSRLDCNWTFTTQFIYFTINKLQQSSVWGNWWQAQEVLKEAEDTNYNREGNWISSMCDTHSREDCFWNTAASFKYYSLALPFWLSCQVNFLMTVCHETNCHNITWVAHFHFIFFFHKSPREFVHMVHGAAHFAIQFKFTTPKTMFISRAQTLLSLSSLHSSFS